MEVSLMPDPTSVLSPTLPEAVTKHFLGLNSFLTQQQPSWPPRQLAVEPFVPMNDGERRILYALENMNRAPTYPPRILLLPSTFLRLRGEGHTVPDNDVSQLLWK